MKRKYPRTFFVDLVRSPEGLTDGELLDLLMIGETSKANFKGGVAFGKWSSPDVDYIRVHRLILSALLAYRRAGCPAVLSDEVN